MGLRWADFSTPKDPAIGCHILAQPFFWPREAWLPVPATACCCAPISYRLFDLGYVSVDENRRFAVSRRLKADFDNGWRYYDLHGTPCDRLSAASAEPRLGQWHEPGNE